MSTINYEAVSATLWNAACWLSELPEGEACPMALGPVIWAAGDDNWTQEAVNAAAFMSLHVASDHLSYLSYEDYPNKGRLPRMFDALILGSILAEEGGLQ